MVEAGSRIFGYMGMEQGGLDLDASPVVSLDGSVLPELLQSSLARKSSQAYPEVYPPFLPLPKHPVWNRNRYWDCCKVSCGWSACMVWHTERSCESHHVTQEVQSPQHCDAILVIRSEKLSYFAEVLGILDIDDVAKVKKVEDHISHLGTFRILH